MKKILLLLCILLPHAIHAAPLPQFNYYDLDLFSVSIAEEFDFHSGLSFDHFNGSTLFHLAFMGGYGDLKYISGELGLGFSLPGSRFLKDQLASRILNVERTPTYYGEQVKYTYQRLRTDIARLRLLEIGVFSLLWSEYAESYPPNDPLIYGTMYYNIDAIDYHANDLILYLGYRMMKVPRQNFTTSEFSWYIRGLLGYTIRQADVWDNSYNTFSLSRDPEPALGAEIGLKFYITQIRAGIYGGFPYFSIGFRASWSRKFHSQQSVRSNTERYP